ncbi:hypothetical protein TKK_0007135 [Trichogramma kaykai]|uniref:Uncharacterized protein n=1 Tax=Trichogramma kaykai TaxID=54128 RepID=A0ABD2XAD0_9HYME
MKAILFLAVCLAAVASIKAGEADNEISTYAPCNNNQLNVCSILCGRIGHRYFTCEDLGGRYQCHCFSRSAQPQSDSLKLSVEGNVTPSDNETPRRAFQMKAL